jgi:NADH dehydrogenase
MNIVIVGGGFGGVKAALELLKNKENSITLISERSYFQYYPALYSTATGHDYKESWVSLTAIFGKYANIKIVKDTIVSFDATHRKIEGSSGTSYSYQELILALGSVTTYFGIEGLDVYSYGIKSEEEIRRLQKHIFTEMSDGTDDEANYVIIGAGPTGVELAGALGEYVMTVRKHFGIRKRKLRISLIEAAPRVLPRLSEKSSSRALKRLKSLGVHVETNRKVEKQTVDSLYVNGKALATGTVIWTSGVTNAPFYKQNESQFTFNERGKVVVDQFMKAREHVYVIGDNAATPFAGLAQTALHDAIFVAKHLKGSKKKYKAQLPPTVIPIGDKWALFEWGKLQFGGRAGVVLRRAADMIGYHDVLPMSWAIGAWKAGTRKTMLIPDNIETK